MSQQNYTRLNYLLKYLGINKTKIAKETGLSYSHVRDSTVPKSFNNWLRFTLYVFDRMLSEIEKLEDEAKRVHGYTIDIDLKEGEMPYAFEARDIYTGTAPLIPYDEEGTSKLIAKYKPKDEKK